MPLSVYVRKTIVEEENPRLTATPILGHGCIDSGKRLSDQIHLTSHCEFRRALCGPG
jgi:hypothetical protein